MAKCRSYLSRHPSMVPQCASELASHQAPPQWHNRHLCRHPTGSSQQAGDISPQQISPQQTSLHSRHLPTASHQHIAAETTTGQCFAASPAFEPKGGRQMRKAGLFHGQLIDHPRVSPGRAQEWKKQQPQRASSNRWWKKES